MIPKIFGTETQETIAQWALSAFGDVKTTRSILTRAGCELAELVHAVECGAPKEKIAAEIADVIIVLCRYPTDLTILPNYHQYHLNASPTFLVDLADRYLLAARGEFDHEWKLMHLVDILAELARSFDIDLPAAIDAKMVINRGRKWVSKGAGHGQHVVEAPTEDSPDFGAKVKAVDSVWLAVVVEGSISPDQGLAFLVAYGIPEATARRVLCPDAAMAETLRLAAEYKTACAAIAPALAVHDASEDIAFKHEALKTYHAACLAAGNARRALNAYVAGETPEVAARHVKGMS